MLKKNELVKYCTGCGLCESYGKCRLAPDDKGFNKPVDYSSDFEEFGNIVCPSSGKQYNNCSNNIWGKSVGYYLGFAHDNTIRKKGSSGGVITSLCIYLLENKIVDGVIQIKENKESPIETEVVISKSKEDVIRCAGSRYSSSSPLIRMKDLLCSNERYAFVGKPCDIDALRNYSKLDASVDKQIIVMISFFCMGVPSRRANEQLLDSMGIQEEKCKSLRYRGDGWPGYATAIDLDENEYRMSYSESWGKILGRDLREICRFCGNGIGETADIACADAWYLTTDNRPDFSEKEGRNLVISRTMIGEKLIREASEKGYIELNDYSDAEKEMRYYQNSQFMRRATLYSRILAMKLMRKKYPLLNKKLLKEYRKNIDAIKEMDTFLGLLHRLLDGRIK